MSFLYAEFFWYRLHTVTVAPEGTKAAFWDPDLTVV